MVVKSGQDTALQNGRNLFVVNLSLSTDLWTCVDGCGKTTYKGRPCVHILKALQSKDLPFFDSRYFHSHWRVTSAVTSKHIQRWCKEHGTAAGSLSSDDDNNDEDTRPDDSYDNNVNVMDPKAVSDSQGDLSVVLRSGADPTKVNGMSNRICQEIIRQRR